MTVKPAAYASLIHSLLSGQLPLFGLSMFAIFYTRSPFILVSAAYLINVMHLMDEQLLDFGFWKTRRQHHFSALLSLEV